MVQHVTLFSFNKNADTVTRKKLLKTLKQLPSYIDFIKSFRLGKDFSQRQTCYEYGLVAEFDSKDDLHRYLMHAIHEEFIQRALPYLDKLAEVDFEFEKEKR